MLGFPGGSSSKEFSFQCKTHKRCRLDPWVIKITWRRKEQPTPIFLPEKPHGQGDLVGYGLKGHKESDMTEHLAMALHTNMYIYTYT